MLFIFTFGIIDLSLAYFQWIAAEKATQFGVRLAIVSDPVATELSDFTGKTPSNAYGESPMPAFADGNVVCDGKTQSCTDGYTFSNASHGRIVEAMQRAWGGGGNIGPENVVVVYNHINLGFVGRPGGPVPSVTVQLQDMIFDFIVLDALGIGPLPMPPFAATLSGEDMSNTLI